MQFNQGRFESSKSKFEICAFSSSQLGFVKVEFIISAVCIEMRGLKCLINIHIIIMRRPHRPVTVGGPLCVEANQNRLRLYSFRFWRVLACVVPDGSGMWSLSVLAGSVVRDAGDLEVTADPWK